MEEKTIYRVVFGLNNEFHSLFDDKQKAIDEAEMLVDSEVSLVAAVWKEDEFNSDNPLDEAVYEFFDTNAICDLRLKAQSSCNSELFLLCEKALDNDDKESLRECVKIILSITS